MFKLVTSLQESCQIKGALWVEFVYSLHACVGFLQAFRFPSTEQKHER